MAPEDSMELLVCLMFSPSWYRMVLLQMCTWSWKVVLQISQVEKRLSCILMALLPFQVQFLPTPRKGISYFGIVCVTSVPV